MDSLKESKFYKALCTSQRHAIIRLIEKPNKDKQFISSRRPILPLNVDQKILSKFSGKVEKSPSIFNRSWSDCICQQQVLKQKLKTHI